MPTETSQHLSYHPSPDDSLPVEGGEELMRRVLKRLAEYDRGKTPSLQAGAFLPTKRDHDGLSLNRRVSERHGSFLTPEGLKHWHEVPENIRETCGVIAVLTEAALAIGLTVKPDPATTPGHVLIEEINSEQFAGNQRTDASREKIIVWALQLAQRAYVLLPPGKALTAPNSTTE